MFEMTEMYRELGISEKVYQFGKEIEKSLEDRFDQIDKVTEFNQLKVIRAMQESRVNEACFNYARDVTRWKKFMQKHFTQNLLWYVRRLPVGHMHLHLH